MNKRLLVAKIILLTGFAAMVLGGIDPMEGVFLIFPGSVLLAFGAWLSGMPRRWLAYMAFILMAVSFAALLLLSALGGFGGSAPLLRSNWWALLLLPYPIGWMMGVAGGALMSSTLFTRVLSVIGVLFAALFLVRLIIFQLVPWWISTAVVILGLVCIIAIIKGEEACSKRNA